MKREKNDDHKCLPTIIKLRIFIVNNQSLKLNDKQRKINKKKHSKINLFRDKSNQTKPRKRKQTKKKQTKPTLQNQTVKLANNLEIKQKKSFGFPGGHQSSDSL